MKRIRQALAWWCFVPNVLTPEQAVQAAVEIGFDGIDLAPREYWPLIQEHGLALPAIMGHRSIEHGLNRREHHDRIEQEIRANLKLAVQWGIANLICFSGNRGGLDDATGAEITAEGLRRVAADAEEAGVTLVLELLNSKRNHPDYQCDRTAWGVQVCQMVGSPRVKLLYDIYHMQVMEGDIIRTIRDYHPYFAHYHTAGNPGRNELASSQELNYPAIIQAIGATAYTGFVSHEFIPTGDPVVGLRNAYALCDLSDEETGKN